jgi:hypothetical protein
MTTQQSEKNNKPKKFYEEFFEKGTKNITEILKFLSPILSTLFLLIFVFYLISFTFKNYTDSNQEAVKNFNTTIDLVNLAIVGGGFIFAVFTIFVSLRMREWENIQDDTKKMFEEMKKSKEDSNTEM